MSLLAEHGGGIRAIVVSGYHCVQECNGSSGLFLDCDLDWWFDGVQVMVEGLYLVRW